jgi:hypothetical protein
MQRHLAILLVALVPAANAQGSLALVADGPRPIAKAIQTLVSEYGYVITYEDPRYVYEGDLEDVTTQVRKDVNKYAPGKVPKIVGPLGDRRALAIRGVAGSQDMATVLNQLVQSKAEHGGHFRVQQTADAFHVVPTEIRDSNGNWAANPSVLDVPISLTARESSEYAMIDAICSAVSVAAHVNVKVGAGVGQGLVPEGGGPPLYHLEASNEAARNVLLRALAATHRGRQTWMLLYDATEREYFLSILEVPDRSPKPQQAQTPAQAPQRTALSPADTVGPTSPQ